MPMNGSHLPKPSDLIVRHSSSSGVLSSSGVAWGAMDACCDRVYAR